jgi:hypothetical protein
MLAEDGKYSFNSEEALRWLQIRIEGDFEGVRSSKSRPKS